MLIFAESSIYSLLVILCALCHEAGHIAAMYLLGAGISEISFLPFGADIRMKNNVGYIYELIIAASGPLSNIICGGILYGVYIFLPNKYILFCTFSSFFLAAINLIPAKSFDGGRIVSCLAMSLLEYEKALKLVRASELMSLLILTFFSVVSVKLSYFNLSIAAICIYLFVCVYLE